MGAILHSFIDIFEAEFDVEEDKVLLKKIVIPLIQRDYAQGRINPDVNRVRSRFLSSLNDAITKNPITLDFVYGDIDAAGTMTPLDGQQRLTTLFLLHWYAAKKEHIAWDKYSFLERFSYETRFSARDFCSELVRFDPSFNEKISISKDIINQAWFPLDWKKDPTISSMLVMLDAIDEQFRNVPGIWNKLSGNAITFYFLPIKDMGLTDELYIKMNSRGKPLTSFEHFKAELERNLRLLDERGTTTQCADVIIHKIDGVWTDLLWRYRNGNSGNSNDNTTDDEFLRYFKFICDIICYQNKQSPQSYSSDEFDLLQQYFSIGSVNVEKNIKMLEAFFDCWCEIQDFSNPYEFLASFMSYNHDPQKIMVDSRYPIDILDDCLHAYSDKAGQARQFPLNRTVLLYAITVYLQHQKDITRDEFIRRIRIVNNLIQNSEDEVSDRLDRNRIPAILEKIDDIILTGEIGTIGNSFNVNQLNEEKEKSEFLAKRPKLADELFALEDHPMLKGQISIIGLENLARKDRFTSLFKCSWDKIDCALMAIGNYGQLERNGRRYQYASQNLQIAWDELFHKSANDGFDNTKSILLNLLATNNAFTDDILEGIAAAFISECDNTSTYPWRYYYVKYPVFRPGSYGKLYNSDAVNHPYLYFVMQTKSQLSQNTYMPYLKAADAAHLPNDEIGQRLVYGEQYIYCEDAAYLLCKRDNGNEVVLERVDIAQNADGIDTEDRILKLNTYLKNKKLII